jgi:hypothetical protein
MYIYKFRTTKRAKHYLISLYIKSTNKTMARNENDRCHSAPAASTTGAMLPQQQHQQQPSSPPPPPPPQQLLQQYPTIQELRVAHSELLIMSPSLESDNNNNRVYLQLSPGSVALDMDRAVALARVERQIRERHDKDDFGGSS